MVKRNITSSLLTSHLHSDRKALGDLIGSLAQDVNADNFLFLADADEFEHGWFFVLQLVECKV